MKKIGITGGIGSGKTTVCKIFRLLGIAVFHADDEAKILQNSDPQIKRRLIERFGENIYSQDGVVDRKKLANVVFNDPSELSFLNSIIHPVVKQKFLTWVEDYQNEPYVLFEAAILFEAGFANNFDQNILVTADEHVRIKRVIGRDHLTEEAVRQRIINQIPDIEKINTVNYIVENNNDRLLIPQIINLDKLIREDNS